MISLPSAFCKDFKTLNFEKVNKCCGYTTSLAVFPLVVGFHIFHKLYLGKIQTDPYYMISQPGAIIYRKFKLCVPFHQII